MYRRILLVESGSRSLIEGVIPHLVDAFGEVPLDLVTCFGGAPAGVTGSIYRVSDYATPAARTALYRELSGNGYQILGIVCSAEPIMTKWKWMLAYRVPASVFMLNENGDYVWAGPRAHLRRPRFRSVPDRPRRGRRRPHHRPRLAIPLHIGISGNLRNGCTRPAGLPPKSSNETHPS